MERRDWASGPFRIAQSRFPAGYVIAPSMVVAVLLFLALLQWPYVYYQFLRWAVCGCSLWIAWIAFDCRRYLLFALLALTALIYNPVLPFHMARAAWEVINVTSGLVMVVAGILLSFVGDIHPSDRADTNPLVKQLQKRYREDSDFRDLIDRIEADAKARIAARHTAADSDDPKRNSTDPASERPTE